MTLMTIPSDSISCSRNAWCVSLNGWNEASSITAIVWPSKSAGSTKMLCGEDSPSPAAMRM
jgi:hypothetical protein